MLGGKPKFPKYKGRSHKGSTNRYSKAAARYENRSAPDKGPTELSLLGALHILWFCFLFRFLAEARPNSRA